MTSGVCTPASASSSARFPAVTRTQWRVTECNGAKRPAVVKQSRCYSSCIDMHVEVGTHGTSFQGLIKQASCEVSSVTTVHNKPDRDDRNNVTGPNGHTETMRCASGALPRDHAVMSIESQSNQRTFANVPLHVILVDTPEASAASATITYSDSHLSPSTTT